MKPAKGAKRATPVSRSAPPGKPVIKQFIRSPNCSSRNVGTKIDKNCFTSHGRIAGQCTGSANHCIGANAGSIGIEHVGSETDALAAPQAAASAALIRWLLQEHQIPRTNIFGHDFTPGYSRPGGTSCLDKLFGPAHSQTTIAAWVAANV